MASQPIPVSLANDMIGKYFTYMSNLGVDMGFQTQSVSFDGTTLQSYLAAVMPYADRLRIFNGVYVDGDPNAGRTTVILWPYKGDQPAVYPTSDAQGRGGEGIEPLNLGGLQP